MMNLCTGCITSDFKFNFLIFSFVTQILKHGLAENSAENNNNKNIFLFSGNDLATRSAQFNDTSHKMSCIDFIEP